MQWPQHKMRSKDSTVEAISDVDVAAEVAKHCSDQGLFTFVGSQLVSRSIG